MDGAKLFLARLCAFPDATGDARLYGFAMEVQDTFENTSLLVVERTFHSRTVSGRGHFRKWIKAHIIHFHFLNLPNKCAL